LAKNFLESDVLSLDFASLLSRFSDFGREIASGILAFRIPTILEATKSCFGRDVAEACFKWHSPGVEFANIIEIPQFKLEGKLNLRHSN